MLLYRLNLLYRIYIFKEIIGKRISQHPDLGTGLQKDRGGMEGGRRCKGRAEEGGCFSLGTFLDGGGRGS
jgi:hypothetical protein